MVEAALQAMGSPYPSDIDERAPIVDRLADRRPGLLDRLDERLYELEAEQLPDRLLDRFVWSHKASFFTQR
jgi:hypothetical protein